MTEIFSNVNGRVEFDSGVYHIYNNANQSESYYLPQEDFIAKYEKYETAFLDAVGFAYAGIAKDAFRAMLKHAIPSWTPEIEKPKDVFAAGILKYPTSHLPHFTTFNNSVGLYGNHYSIITKTVYYSIVGAMLNYKQDEETVPRRVSIGKVKDDLRLHVAIPIPSGQGKLNYASATRRLIEAFELKFVSPTSLHPEQLVGKTVEQKTKKERVFEQVRGHLADDFLFIDEGFDFLTSTEPQYEESRKYLRLAQDPYGENEISKRMVGIPRENALKYFPSASVIMAFQPKTLPADLVIKGTLRRFAIPFVEFEERDRTEDFARKVESETDDLSQASESQKFIRFLKGVRDGNHGDFTFEEDAVKRFVELHLRLYHVGLALGSQANAYTELIAFTLQNRLAKFSALNAAINKRNFIKKQDVESAFVDLSEIFIHELNFVSKMLDSPIILSDKLDGAKPFDLNALRWLRDSGAESLESSNIPVRALKLRLQESHGVGKDMADKHYDRLKRKGLVDSKQVGQYDSRVWLTPKALSGLEDFEEGKGSKGSNIGEYFSLWKSEYEKITLMLQPLQPLLPSTDGGNKP